jgi:hypothetical protein
MFAKKGEPMRAVLFVVSVLLPAFCLYAVDPEPDFVQDQTASQDLPVKGKPKKFIGKLVFVDDGNYIIAVQNEKKKKLQFFIPDSAHIYKNGVPVPAKTPKKKNACTVTYRKQNKLLICLDIQQ